MSMLSVIRSVMDSNGWPTPVAGIAGSQDQNVRQSLALINKTLVGVSYKKTWPELCRDYVFDTVANQEAYDLPEDFHHLVVGTAFSATKYAQLRGALSPSNWYRCEYGANNSSDNYRVERHGNKFHICPTPTAVEQVAFMYVTKNLVRDVDGNYRPRYEVDTDVSVVDEELIESGLSWRWRQKKGMDFSAEVAEHTAAMRERFAQYLNSGEISIAKQPEAILTDGNIGSGPIGVV